MREVVHSADAIRVLRGGRCVRSNHTNRSTPSCTQALPSATLIVLGAVITVLGFLLAGNFIMALTGLLSIFAGGLLGILERRVAR